MRILRIIGLVFLIFAVLLLIVAVAGLLFLKFYPSVGDSPGTTEKEQFKVKTPLFHDGEFHNEQEFSLMSGKGYPASPRRKPQKTITAETPQLLTDTREKDLTFTWLGHSSFLLQLGGTNILVDPVLSEFSSPVSFAGPKRFSEVPITVEQLPEIDILFLSHDHYDHMDYETIRGLKNKVKRFIVPVGIDSILRGWDVEDDKICTLYWWENIEIEGISYTLTPSQHFSGRNPLKRNITYWGGLFISNDFHRIYYTGDGGYCDVFKDIRTRLGSPDLMISECGQYDPSWASVHMFPEEAVQATLDTGALWMIPVHWGSFCICNHSWDDSIIRVTDDAKKRDVKLATPQMGQTINFDNIESFNEAWWEEYK